MLNRCPKKYSVALHALAAVLAVTNGCSLVVEAQDQQCSNDADCTALGAPFEGTFCNEQSVCQRRDEYCFTNQQCQERTGSETTVCRQSDHLCIDLLTKECPKLLADRGDLLNNPVIIGHLGFPSTAPQLLAGENALEMARQEFRNIAGGLPGTPSRPVVVIACDSSPLNTEEHKRAADHVIDEVGVPIVFGVVPASWAAYALPKAREKDTLILSAGADTINETSEERRGILFRNRASQTKAIEAQALLIEQVIEPKVRATLPEGEPLRVAMVYSDEGASATNGTLFFQKVRFNGKSAAENGANYKQFTMGSPSQPDFSATFSKAVLDATAFKPHIVVIYDGEDEADMAVQMENALPGQAHYLIGAAGVIQKVVDGFGNDESKRRRLWAMQNGQPSTDPNYSQFLLQYGAEFGDSIGGQIAGIVGAPQYDEYYLAMFALVANAKSPTPFSGRALGQTIMDRMRSGSEIGMGALYIDEAVQKLQRGENIIYRGAATTSQFNDNGDVTMPYLVLCIAKDQALTNRFIESGLYFDQNNKLTGTDTCD
jgi:hypothetical protein